jgi:hypothetical protein
MGLSKLATRLTGASIYLKQFSIISAEILAEKLNKIKVKCWYKNLLSLYFEYHKEIPFEKITKKIK